MKLNIEHIDSVFNLLHVYFDIYHSCIVFVNIICIPLLSVVLSC